MTLDLRGVLHIEAHDDPVEAVRCAPQDWADFACWAANEIASLRSDRNRLIRWVRILTSQFAYEPGPHEQYWAAHRSARAWLGQNVYGAVED